MSEWRDIPGYEGRYQASDVGQIRSLGPRGRILAESTDKDGYKKVNVCRGRYDVKKGIVHRLVMAAFHGTSTLHVDHLNGVRGDNRLANLEYVTNRENQLRAKERQGTKSGMRGAAWHKQNQKWQSEIRINNVRHYLGTFDSREEAAMAYQKAKQERGAA